MRVSRERERTITVLSVVVTLIAVLGFLTFDDGPLGTAARGLVGAEDRLRAPVEADYDGAYAFLNTQRGSDTPVGFSPCRPIRYVVNPDGAPDGWEGFVEDAVREVGDRTGLQFEDQGTTDDRDFDRRVSSSGSAEPVLIGWADEDEVGDLADDVAGIGGPTMTDLGGRRAYVTGAVVLDTDLTDRLEDEPLGDETQVALLLHELGHLVGLDHVDDPDELMYPTGLGRSSYGPGDLAGLATLGAIPCR